MSLPLDGNMQILYYDYKNLLSDNQSMCNNWSISAFYLWGTCLNFYKLNPTLSIKAQ